MIITLKGTTFTKFLDLNSWMIISDLVGVTSSNTATKVTKGDPYTTTFTIDTGCTLTEENVSVVCNGVTKTLTWDKLTEGDTATLSFTPDATVYISIKATGASSGGTVVNPDTGSYTITYRYLDGSGAAVKASETETVAAGTVMNFTTTDSRATVDGYTCNSVSQASATINSNITITYTYTANEAGGENDSTIVRYALAPKNMVTGKLVNKTTGASEDSTSSRYNEYTVDEAWTLYADGYNASLTAKSGGVTYFNAADTYLGYDTLGEDSYGAEFEGELLTVPAGTTTVKVLSSSGKIDPALYRETTGVWTALTSDSTVVGKVTNKETGELEDSTSGRYTSYTVEDSWILCADGYASAKSAAVSYFDASGNYLGYDSLGGLSSVVFEKVTLAVPSGTATIRVQAAAAGQSMALYKLV